MKKIRVMHLLYYLSIGGLEQVVLNLTRQLDRNRYEPSVACLRESGTLKAEFEKQNIPVFEFNSGEGLAFDLPFKLARLIKTQRVDIVHTHDLGPYLYGTVAAKLARVPVVIHTEHSYLTQNTQLLKLSERVLSWFTNKIISDSDAVTRFLVDEEQINPRKITTILNGVDTDRFSKNGYNNKLKKSLGLPDDSKVIGTVGRLVEVKDQHSLITAFAAVRKKVESCHLIIVGDGPLKENLKQLASQLGVDDYVHFPGKRRDIPQILDAMDIFVLSSLSEGLSLSLLEAMAASKPVIATAVGGNIEIINSDEVGVLVPARNPIALAEKLIRLLSKQSAAYEMGKKARQRVIEKFSLSAMTRAYQDVYEEFLI